MIRALLPTLLVSFTCLAGGIIALKGNLLGCDKMFCQLKVGGQVYKIELAKLSDDQKKIFLSKKAEDMVDLSIAMSAIADVKDYSSTSKPNHK